MKNFADLFTNRIFMTAVAAWFCAQVIKTCINYRFTKKWVWERLVGSGGMPSCHSATVCSLATITGIECGMGSVEFAIAALFGFIVMYDARGVRRETGKQAVLLNQIRDYLLFGGAKAGKPKPDFSDENLKELIGHTPLQVGVGAVIGIAVGLVSGLLIR